MAGSGSQPSSSWTRCSAARSAALLRSFGYLANAFSSFASKRFCCSALKGEGAGPAFVDRGIIGRARLLRAARGVKHAKRGAFPAERRLPLHVGEPRARAGEEEPLEQV